MNKLENIETQIRKLSREELADFREWFAQFDAELWDAQFEADARAGKLDAAAERALQEHKSGKSKML
jgi:hypothetical protein